MFIDWSSTGSLVSKKLLSAFLWQKIISLTHLSRLSGSENRKGFTLLEILIAIFILATVLSTIYAAYSGTFRIIHDSERESEIYGAATVAMNRILKDLGAVAASGGAVKFVGRISDVAGPDCMELTFGSRAHLALRENEASGTLAEITYYVDDQGPEGSFRLLRRDVLNAYSGNEEQNQDGFVICEGLQSLIYKFADKDGTERDSWDSTSDAGGVKNKAPALVSIELKLVNPQDKERPYVFFTKVFLPVAITVPAPP